MSQEYIELSIIVSAKESLTHVESNKFTREIFDKIKSGRISVQLAEFDTLQVIIEKTDSAITYLSDILGQWLSIHRRHIIKLQSGEFKSSFELEQINDIKSLISQLPGESTTEPPNPATTTESELYGDYTTPPPAPDALEVNGLFGNETTPPPDPDALEVNGLLSDETTGPPDPEPEIPC